MVSISLKVHSAGGLLGALCCEAGLWPGYLDFEGRDGAWPAAGRRLGTGSVRPRGCTIGIVQSARSPQPRSGGEFFARPADPTQRRYEALRAYLLEGRPAAEVAQAFGYTLETLNSMVRDFREFFVSSRPGPKRAPLKERAHARIVELRAGVTRSTRSRSCSHERGWH